jgi:hypothetical protein
VAKAGKSRRSAVVVGIGKDCRVKTEDSPREHEEFSHVIASSATVFYSTGTILRRKGNGNGSKFEVKSRKFKGSKSSTEEHTTLFPTTNPVSCLRYRLYEIREVAMKVRVLLELDLSLLPIFVN